MPGIEKSLRMIGSWRNMTIHAVMNSEVLSATVALTMDPGMIT